MQINNWKETAEAKDFPIGNSSASLLRTNINFANDPETRAFHSGDFLEQIFFFASIFRKR